MRIASSFPNGQRGVVLFIALIVLVAMALAGVALVRSVDTGNVIAGNLAFKQGTINASDNGVQVAYQWLVDNRPALANTSTGDGYFSSQPGEPDPALWTDWKALAADGAGNTVSYIIHRMCTQANAQSNEVVAGVANQCATNANTSTAAGEGDSLTSGATVFTADPRIYYRITTRTIGPRNTSTYTQVMVAVAL